MDNTIASTPRQNGGTWNRYRRQPTFLEVQLEVQLSLLDDQEIYSPVERINASREIRTILTCQLHRIPMYKLRKVITVCCFIYSFLLTFFFIGNP